MSEITEDNCVLSDFEMLRIDYWLKGFNEITQEYCKNDEIILDKINELNDLVYELHSRNITVKDCVKYYELGKKNYE